MNVREVEKIQEAFAKEKSKIVKSSGIDRRSQNEYADKLSRPHNRLRMDQLSQAGHSRIGGTSKRKGRKENGEDRVHVLVEDTNESSV